MNGIDGVKNVMSVSREQVSLVSVEFDLDRDLEAATNDVRDRVARAIRDLPEEVEDPVVAKRDSDARPILWMALSGDGHDPIALTQMADKLLVDRMAKLPGVASVVMFGERRYSMRVWLDNHLLHSQSVNVADVANALRRQNVDIPSGRLESEDTEFTVRSLGELHSPEEFGNLVIKSFGPKLVRLRDVARVEVGAESLRKQVNFNGKAAVGVGVVKQSNANTIDVVDGAFAGVAPMPPFTLIALVGPAIALHNTETLAAAFPDRFYVSPALERIVAARKGAYYGPDGALDPEVEADPEDDPEEDPEL